MNLGNWADWKENSKIWSTQEFALVRRMCVRMSKVTPAKWCHQFKVEASVFPLMVSLFVQSKKLVMHQFSQLCQWTPFINQLHVLWIRFSVEWNASQPRAPQWKSSGLVSAACGYVCWIHRHGTTINLTSNKCLFSPGNAVIQSLGSNFHFLANLPFTWRHL